jgi:hypothetical protein
MESTFHFSPFTSRQLQNGRPSRNTQHTQLIQHEDNSAEFINVTDTVDLDKSSKTKVRVQVMKDYHRRRIQKIDESGNETLDQRPEPPVLSAKAQTQKFRLGDERILRPWKPKKGGHKKNKDKTMTDDENQFPTRNPKSRSPTSQNVTPEEGSYLSEDIIDRSFIEPHDTKNESSDSTHQTTEEWLSNLQHYVQSSMLHLSPSSGMHDPFAAMSLLITPRIQRLLHHYCKPPLPLSQQQLTKPQVTLRLPTSWLMMPMRRAFHAHSLHDPALFHIFLSHYAASYHNYHPHSTSTSKAKSDPDEAIYHRTMAIKIVNERIREKKDELSDGSVGAVANLAIYEVRY